MGGLKTISYHADLDPLPPGTPARGPAGIAGPMSVEQAAKSFLESLVIGQVPSVRGVAGDTLGADEQFKRVSTTRAPSGDPASISNFVAFQQLHRNVPIFGVNPTVECNGMTPIAVSGHAAEKPDVAPTPGISKADAIKAAARGGKETADAVELVYFDADDGWHLAFHVQGVTVPGAASGKAHGLGGSPRSDSRLRNVLVDATTGAILLDYSATPMIAISPTHTTGLDEGGIEREFYTLAIDDQLYELRDELNRATTYDHAEKDITQAPPPNPVRHAGGKWADQQRAAVSAHFNAVIVQDYFRSKLKRAGLDNLNGELKSIVRSTYSQHEQPPVWRNAVWWKNAMWYGQVRDGTGRMVSFATRLEIAAHEMTHGLIDHTAKLIYLNESGALNESFSDLFGVIIANSHLVDANSTARWSWVIGEGLGVDGKDIRDFSDPTRLGYPIKYSERYSGAADDGGVHINSNIHNRAVYNVLTATDAQGTVFKPDEVALLYYLALLRLGPTSTFRDGLEAVLHATATLYRTRGPTRQLDAIKSAYAAVEITI